MSIKTSFGIWNIQDSNVNTVYVYPTLDVERKTIWWDLNIVIRANEEGVLVEKRPPIQKTQHQTFIAEREKKKRMHSAEKVTGTTFGIAIHRNTSYWNYFCFNHSDMNWKEGERNRPKETLFFFCSHLSFGCGICFSRACLFPCDDPSAVLFQFSFDLSLPHNSIRTQ